MNHKELIERLRTSPAFDNTTLGNEAADAIEELQEILLNVENAHAVVAGAYGNILRERDTLRQQLAEAQRDAERYRWLRQARSQHAQVMTWADGIDEWVVWHTAEDVDTAIYAAMKGAA